MRTHTHKQMNKSTNARTSTRANRHEQAKKRTSIHACMCANKLVISICICTYVYTHHRHKLTQSNKLEPIMNEVEGLRAWGFRSLGLSDARCLLVICRRVLHLCRVLHLRRVLWICRCQVATTYTGIAIQGPEPRDSNILDWEIYLIVLVGSPKWFKGMFLNWGILESPGRGIAYCRVWGLGV